jgi:cytoskeleton protein RodZ
MQPGSNFSAPVSAHRVGEDLRAARERLGWSLAETSAYLRIRRPSLEALEAGRVAELPGQAYALGFIRSYAKALGLDAEEMVRRYNEEAGSALPQPELNFPAPLPQTHVPPGAVVLLGCALVVVGYAGWYRVSANHAEGVKVQQVPARLAPLALPVVPPPPPARVASAAPTAPTQAVTAYHLPSVSPSAAEASAPPPGSLAPVQPAPSTTLADTTPAPGQIILTATADAWVQVKDGQGHIVLSKVMHAGDRWAVPDQPAGAGPMVMTTGNAGGTQLSLGGRILPSLGANGAVRRDIPLDATSLKDSAG